MVRAVLLKMNRLIRSNRLIAIYMVAMAIISCRFIMGAPAGSTPRDAGAPAPGATSYPPCDPSSVINVTRVSHVMVDSYCGVSPMQTQLSAKYLQAALADMPDGIDPGVQVVLFVDLEQGAKAEYQWERARGYQGLNIQSIRDSWEGFSGRELDGMVLLFLKDGLGNEGTSSGELADLVLHEMHHVLQDELQTGSLDLPPWWTEGGARSFSYRQLSRLGFPDWSFRSPDEGECNYPLPKLAYDDPKVPVDCRYLEGERAVTLLVDAFGPERYYEMFRLAVAGRSFAGIFARVYHMPLQRFYSLFDEYRDSGYTDAPTLIPFGSAAIKRIPQ